MQKPLSAVFDTWYFICCGFGLISYYGLYPTVGAKGVSTYFLHFYYFSVRDISCQLRFDNRINTRSEAIRRLLNEALKRYEKKPTKKS